MELTTEQLEYYMEQNCLDFVINSKGQLELVIYDGWKEGEPQDEDHDPSTIYVWDFNHQFRHIAS